MPLVELPQDDLFAHRAYAIGQMLAELQGSHVACQAYSRSVQRGRVFAAHNGGIDPNTNYQDWRFRSTYAKIECQYFELWRPVGNTRKMYLDRAYLHTFLIDHPTRTSRNIVCVHTDPNDAADDELLRQYKRGLHLHVTAAEHPIPKCHFPLGLSHLDDHLEQILQSPDTLTTAIRTAAIAIHREVVLRYEQDAI